MKLFPALPAVLLGERLLPKGSENLKIMIHAILEVGLRTGLGAGRTGEGRGGFGGVLKMASAM